MKIAVIGTGYVGLVTAACLADLGHFVIGVDKDRQKIDYINQGRIPIYEPGLQGIVRRNHQEERLSFTTDLGQAMADAQVVFIGVGTPTERGGAADLTQVEMAAIEIAQYLHDYKVIVIKSTVPVGTNRRIKQLIAANLRDMVEYDIVSNPEFLREGSAVADFIRPDRVVIGTESAKAEAMMKEIYRTCYSIGTPFVFTNFETAELIKYANNAFLATKITFINEIANLCEAVGGDVQVVAKGIGFDKRINQEFLHAGPGYGGSCFPKDTKALALIGRKNGEPISIIEAVIRANEAQKQRMIAKIGRMVKDLKGRRLALLGLAFKPNTDDMREAPAITIIRGLLRAGAELRVHDPEAMNEARKIFANSLSYCQDPYEAADQADALIIVTEWNCYRRLDLDRMRRIMRQPIIVDLRNVYTVEEASKAGFRYEGVGRTTGPFLKFDENEKLAQSI